MATGNDGGQRKASGNEVLEPTSWQANENAMNKTSRGVHYPLMLFQGMADSRDSTPECGGVCEARCEINFPEWKNWKAV